MTWVGIRPGDGVRERTSGQLALVLVATGVLLVTTAALALTKGPDVDFKIHVAAPQQALAVGSTGEAVVTMTAPSGIRFNKYPPIRVTVEENPPITFDQTTVKAGLDTMPENLEANHFDSVDPIHLRFTVGAHRGDAKVPIKGKIKFTYCVAKSGFCAPATKDIAFEVPVSSQ